MFCLMGHMSLTMCSQMLLGLLYSLFSFLPRCFEVELIMVDDVVWLISSLCILKELLASFAPSFHLHALLIKGGKICSIACARSCPGLYLLPMLVPMPSSL
ncbi:hypothetical protein Droror1_Dr00012939 [Drosera rotundifolia]